MELTRVHVLFWALLGECFIKSSFWFKFKRTFLPVEFMSSLSFISRWKCDVWKLRLTTCVLQVRSSAVTTWILFALQKIPVLTDQRVYSVLMSRSWKEVFSKNLELRVIFLNTCAAICQFCFEIMALVFWEFDCWSYQLDFKLINSGLLIGEHAVLNKRRQAGEAFLPLQVLQKFQDTEQNSQSSRTLLISPPACFHIADVIDAAEIFQLPYLLTHLTLYPQPRLCKLFTPPCKCLCLHNDVSQHAPVQLCVISCVFVSCSNRRDGVLGVWSESGCEEWWAVWTLVLSDCRIFMESVSLGACRFSIRSFTHQNSTGKG